MERTIHDELAGGDGAPVGELVEHLFRHTAGRMVSTLTRLFGPRNLALAEEVVQEALVRALEVWPHRGIPENPDAWLMTVARRRALDLFRREANLRRKAESGLLEDDRGGRYGAAESNAEALPDDALQMMFLCCHPALSRNARLVLTLKTIGGLSVDEIARALLIKPSAVAQRLVRTKRLLRERHLDFGLPARQITSRLGSVLEVIYLLFNEGYAALSGDDLVRQELCGEAVRLAQLLTEQPATDRPAVHALLALLLFQASRLPARTGVGGELQLLASQDRSLWDRRLIAMALHHLERAATGPRVTAYHLEAGIACLHAVAPAWEATDWPRILALYDI